MKRLYRPRRDQIIAGVCAGIANYLNIDPAIVRLIFVLLFMINPTAAIIVYVVAWIIIPEEPIEGYKPQVEERREEQGLVILGLLLILAGSMIYSRIFVTLREIFGIILLVLGFFIILKVLLKREKQ